KRQIFQGPDTGTPIETVHTCYNGAAPDCTTVVPTWPFTQISETTQLSNGLQKQTVTFKNSVGLTTEVDDYDYGTNAVGSLRRKKIIQYASLGNNILDRPSSVTVQDGGGTQVAQATYSYDEVAPDATSGVPAHNAVTGSRGNATTVKRWLNPSNTFLSTSNEYDDTGNLVATTDPLGNKTTLSYADNFSDGVNRSSLAYVTQATLPDTNAIHHITSAKYEPNSGLRVSSIDQNGNQTDYSYDSMLR